MGVHVLFSIGSAWGRDFQCGLVEIAIHATANKQNGFLYVSAFLQAQKQNEFTGSLLKQWFQLETRRCSRNCMVMLIAVAAAIVW